MATYNLYLRSADLQGSYYEDKIEQVLFHKPTRIRQPLYFSLLQTEDWGYRKIKLVPEGEGHRRIKALGHLFKRSIDSTPERDTSCGIRRDDPTASWYYDAPLLWGPFTMTIPMTCGVSLLDSNNVEVFRAYFLGGPHDAKQGDYLRIASNINYPKPTDGHVNGYPIRVNPELFTSWNRFTIINR